MLKNKPRVRKVKGWITFFGKRFVVYMKKPDSQIMKYLGLTDSSPCTITYQPPKHIKK